MSSEEADGVGSTSHEEADRGGSTSTTECSKTPSEESLEEFANSKDQFATLAKSLSTFNHVEIEHLRGGSYNRIVVARLTSKSEYLFSKLPSTLTKRLPLLSKLVKHSRVSGVQGVFRTPRDPNITSESGDGEAIDYNILDQAAVLELVAAHNISAPKLLAFDASAANVVSGPYVFQQYCDGQKLDFLYDGMSLSEKLSIADALLDFLISMEHVRFEKMGKARNSSHGTSPIKWTSLQNSTRPDLKVDIHGVDISRLGSVTKMEPCVSLADFLSTQLSAWRDYERAHDQGDVAPNTLQALSDISEEMKTDGIFSGYSDHGSILFHWDLAPRNILVKRSSGPVGSESKWTIDKIVDWDEILAVPPVMTRQPPTWLWDFSDDVGHSSRKSLPSDYDGDADLYPPSRYDSTANRLSAENQSIREHFESQLISALADLYQGYNREAYDDEAYGRGRWIRRLARFAIHGISSNYDFTRFDHLEAEWTATRSQHSTTIVETTEDVK